MTANNLGLRACLLLTLFASLLLSCTTPHRRVVPAVVTPYSDSTLTVYAATKRSTTLKVMTLNMAHSRGDGFHQLLQNTQTAEANLDTIAALLNRQKPDIIALQESDGPSFWSGNFHHIEHLAKYAAFDRYVHGEHAKGPGLSYGTALLSNLELQDPLAVTFDPSLSPVPKGFVVATITWPEKPYPQIDIASVHLDFLSESTRRKQALELIETLQTRRRQMVLMGDFNTEWEREKSALQFIAQELSLKAYDPSDDDLVTFPKRNARIDWILISDGIRFVSHRILPDVVSDHRVVVAELTLSYDE